LEPANPPRLVGAVRKWERIQILDEPPRVVLDDPIFTRVGDTGNITPILPVSHPIRQFRECLFCFETDDTIQGRDLCQDLLGA
jgi:hypothetical protein